MSRGIFILLAANLGRWWEGDDPAIPWNIVHELSQRWNYMFIPKYNDQDSVEQSLHFFMWL